MIGWGCDCAGAGPKDFSCVQFLGIKIESDNRKAAVQDWWTKMLCQIPQITKDRAEAISQAYPTPHDLMAVYNDDQKTTEDKELLLRDLKAKAQDRRLGPALSKKIFEVFTSSSGDQIVT